ncbi:hypothetical protein ARMGADRAFT_57522 [Armillaria gallica]|uniref:Uncharacterized protein n=1 Tax=Armillaria gallica TaxID=47427 RepID=A0A2H3EB19_ARMGA|nr:hypothetical protein ARMGADRAFT_57522 [Armillaria gallica]
MIGRHQPGVWKALFIRLHLAMGVQNSSEKKDTINLGVQSVDVSLEAMDPHFIILICIINFRLCVTSRHSP